MPHAALSDSCESDDRFYVAPSTIEGAGRGLFARCPLSVGDRLKALGVLLERDSVSDQCTAYADEYKLRVRDQLLLPVGYAALVNHSDAPNLERHIENGSLYLRVTRPVAAGEELFITYSAYACERFGIAQDSIRK